ncbi:MAG: hypothetical protein GF330_13050, partial [Candidatus Eisenbacteria bacterium]|nr:hypothetical protein [Candidatus Eisenbacteria bacterium]
GGLALGSFLFGRWADRWKRHLRVYALLELGIGVCGLLMPALLAGLHQLSPSLLSAVRSDPTRFSILTFTTAFLALLAPTTLMGATLPVLAKHLARRSATLGRRVGLLYAINTFGGVAGTFGSAFLLIALLGVRMTNAVAVALNLALCAAALWLSRGSLAFEARRHETEVAGVRHHGATALEARRPRANTARAPMPHPAPAPGVARLRLVIGAFALAGATSLAYEVLLTRMGVFFLWDTTVYSFATMLTTFLTGLAIGSLLLARIVDRVGPLTGVFGLLEIGIGLSCLLLLPLLQHLVGLRWWLWEGFYASGELAIWRYLALKFVMAFSIMLMPAILMGGTFPIVNRIVSRDPRHLGRNIGVIYSANTIGAIAGALLAGFWLVPALGLESGLLAVVVVNVLLGAVLLLHEPAWRPLTCRFAAASAVALLLVGALITPTGRPAVHYSDLLSNPHLQRELVYAHEGREASLAVLRDPTTRILELNINGQSTAFTSYMDLQVHRALGHVPALCHPEPHTALVIGFGFGSTCHSLLTHGLEQLDCVELVPEERETADLFAAVNEDVLDDPRLRFIPGDGRNHILLTDRRYDIISFNAIHPKLSANLYTLEFYELCRRRLTDDGVIAAWLPINFLSRAEFEMLVRTFQRVYPHTSFWYLGPGHAILIATPQPTIVDYERIEGRLQIPALAQDLARSNLDDPAEILSLLLFGEAGVATLGGEGALNTDDRPRIEFGICFGSQEWYATLQEIYHLAERDPPAMIRLPEKPPARQAAAERLARFFDVRRYALFGSMVHGVGVAMHDLEMIRLGIENYRKAVEIAPESRNTARLLRDKQEVYRRLTAGRRGTGS